MHHVDKVDSETDGSTKIGSETSTPSEPCETSSPASPPERALAEERDVAAAAAPFTNAGDVLEILPHSRRGTIHSHSSESSDDSQRTVSDVAHDHQVPTHRSRSHSRARSSTRSVVREAVVVPRAQRRGLLARLTLIAEITDPYAYARKKKWVLTLVVALAGAAAPMGSSLVLPALNDIAATFDTSATVVNLSVAMYMLSMSIFPLWWSSFSETLGRRTIYLTSFALFFVFNILAAVSTNIAMFVVMRTLSGGAAASVQAVGAGTISDIWEVRERGRAMGIFYLGPLCGPLISPILGGVLAQSLGWRSAQWALAIFAAILCVSILFFLPETLAHRLPLASVAEEEAEEKIGDADEKSDNRPALSRTTTKKSVQVKTTKYLVMLRRAFIDPLRIILYLQFPAIAVTVYYSTVTFCTLYMLNISVQQTFSSAPYNYPSIIVGLLYLPNSLGYFLTSVFGGRWIDNIMRREAIKAGRYDEKGRLKFRPEDRMKENVYIGAALWPVSIIIYGWLSREGLNIAGPMICNFFFGLGSMLVFGTVTTMLTEFMPRKASNGVALNNFCRNIFSCIGVIITSPLIDAIGNGWLFTGMGIIALVSGVLAIGSLKRYGDHWRISMDKKMEKVMGD
nr:mfs transporter ops2 [Quercus suber]